MLTDERRGCLAPHAHAALILERCALQGAVRMEGQLTFLAKREREAKKNKPKLGHMPGVVENLRMTSTVVDTGNGKLSSFFFPISSAALHAFPTPVAVLFGFNRSNRSRCFFFVF